MKYFIFLRTFELYKVVKFKRRKSLLLPNVNYLRKKRDIANKEKGMGVFYHAENSLMLLIRLRKSKKLRRLRAVIK